ncbi:MAG: T9SS type A sorting domain-containing protein [Bacteroidetes bacterium]|nr:T9SS type A sorting domain-containing protein [Bacteroidota bacterium]
MLLVAVIVSIPHISYSQKWYYQPDNSVKVFDGAGNQKALAWCGGFDNPQFNMADLNHDGLADMVVFDRGIGLRTFINKGSVGNPNYVYTPEYERNFPPIDNYLIMADYNCDNIPDLFQSGIEGVAGFDVWKGYYNGSNQLCFTHYQQLFYSNDVFASGSVNAYCNPGDIPAVVDVDNDGDLDFLAYDVFGSTVSYYKNEQVEDGLPCDSIRIKLRDNCWGKFYQGYELPYHLKYTCDNSGLTYLPGEKKTHTGNAICLLDMDGDGDKDYLGGNISYPYLVYCTNAKKGSLNNLDSMVYQDTMWQSSGTPVYLPQWPAAYNVDVDQDGKKDILVAPNTKGENYKCIFYYKNTGTATAPAFTYQSDTFLIDKTIDAGTGAYPVFFDYNKDGKPDLFIGSDGYYQLGGTYVSRVSYYLNTSTPGNPSFTLQTNNFLNLDTFKFRGASLAVGDIDNDGKADLIMGHSDGTLSYFTNTAASDAVQPVWVLMLRTVQDVLGNNITTGGNAAPFIYDLDKDGKPDLISGNYTGYLLYYQNVSTTAGAIQLKLINAHLGGVKVDKPWAGHFNSVPFIGKIDTSGKDYLLVGSYSGSIYRYDGFQTGDTSSIFTMLDSAYSYIDTAYLVKNNGGSYDIGVYDGFRSAPAVADVDADGKYEMVVGDAYGGLMFYKWDTAAPVGVPQVSAPVPEKLINIYPNPATDKLTISWSGLMALDAKQVFIVNIAGQQIASYTVPKARTDISISTATLPAGVYICVLQSVGEKYFERFTILR